MQVAVLDFFHNSLLLVCGYSVAAESGILEILNNSSVHYFEVVIPWFFTAGKKKKVAFYK